MLKTDRTTKLLLAAIVVLLAVLVFRPMLPVAPDAHAQSAIPVEADTVELGYRIPQPTTIRIPANEYVREIQVIDSAQSFLVRYDNRIEVYRIQIIQTSLQQYQQYLRNNRR